jgi:hypothetical protein
VIKQMRARSWAIVAAMATVAILAMGPLGAIDASATTLSFTQQGGFSFGSATWTNHGPAVSGVEYFGATGFLADPTSPNAGQPTFGQIGWGCGSATSSAPQQNCAGLGTVAPRSPVTGLPGVLPADFPVKFRSALDLDVFTGQVTVGGDWVNISSLQHYNRTIGQSANSLTRIDIDTLLSLNTIPPTTGDSDPGFVRIGFNETLNFPPSGSCAPGTGSEPCADIFSFEVAVLDPVFVTVGGVTYRLEFQLIFPPTTFDERTGGTVANGATSCISPSNVCTAEDAISEAIIQMRVIALAVPAPASLLLLGFALSGLGVAGWLRRA